MRTFPQRCKIVSLEQAPSLIDANRILEGWAERDTARCLGTCDAENLEYSTGYR